MKIDLFTDTSVFEKLGSGWNALLHRSAVDTLFLTQEWQSAWWQHLGDGSLRVITIRDDASSRITFDFDSNENPLRDDASQDGGTLIGIAPLFAEAGDPKSLSLVGCVDVSDYLDLIVARGEEERVYAALLDALARPDFPGWDWVRLCTLPAASPTNTRLKAMAEARGFRAEQRLHDVSPVIELPETWESYLEMLDKKQRHEVRRKLRRVEEANTRWYTIDDDAALDAAVADFIELHKKSRPDKNLFMDVRMQNFFVEMTRRLFAQGWLQLSFLEIDGVRAASIMNFVYQNDILVYNSGYDPVKYGSFSPGIVLFARSIQDAIAAKRRCFDFLRGDEEYKYRFGARDTQVMELHIGRMVA